MKHLKLWTLIGVLTVGIMGARALPVSADCPNGDAGDNVITCDTDLPPVQSVEAGIGNDTITVDSDVTVGQVRGDGGGNTSYGQGQAGDDIITNNGTITSNVLGDYSDSTLGGNDTITNNGTIGGSIYGDYQLVIILPKGGNDTIINNGTVEGGIHGDFSVQSGGDDTIVNNGVVNEDISGDSSVTIDMGDDHITNNGTVNGNVTGDNANDTINNNGAVANSIYGDAINVTEGGDDNITNSGTVGHNIDAGAGDDTVTLVVGSTVGGTVSGGTDTDTLIFSGETTDSDGYDQIQSMLGCNPCAGTVTLDGKTYTFDTFEALKNLLVLLVNSGVTSVDIQIETPVNNNEGRMNQSENGAPFALYCNSDSITITDIGANSQGVGEFHYSLSNLPPASDEPIVLASGEGNQLILQPDGTLLAVGASFDGTKTYSLHFTTDCQSLGAGQES